MQLDQGDVDAAVEWAADRSVSAEDDLDYVHEYEHITLARTLVARGAAARLHLERAMGLLDRLRTKADEGQRTGSVVEVLVLLSRGHHVRGDAPAERAALEEALVRAAPEGLVRVFLDERAALRAGLEAGALQGAAADHARRVLATVPSDAPGPRRAGLVDELSSRELDVLRLLRSELSGPDIARELLVSLNTFRTHTKNIYAKLGVNNRREAIRRAAELRL